MFNSRFLAEELPTFKDENGSEFYMCGLCSRFPLIVFPEINGLAHVTCPRCHPDRQFLQAEWNHLNQQSRDRMSYAVTLEKELNALYDRFHIILTHCGEALRG